MQRVSSCAAVRKREDIMDLEEYTSRMRMTNAEQYELLREIIHRQTTPRQQQLCVFFTGPAGCGKTFVLRLAMDIYNRYGNPSGEAAYNAYVVCASTGKAAVAVGGTTVHAAFKLLQQNDRRWAQPQRTQHVSRGVPPSQVRDNRRNQHDVR